MTCRLSAALNNGVSLLKATDALRVNAFINQWWPDYGGSLFADIDDIAPRDGVNISSCRPGCVGASDDAERLLKVKTDATSDRVHFVWMAITMR